MRRRRSSRFCRSAIVAGIIEDRNSITSKADYMVSALGAGFVIWLLIALTLISFLSGCSSARKKPKKIWTLKQAEKQLFRALEAEWPDDRRRAIESLTISKYVASDNCVKTMATIVRTDSSQSVRRAAARSLGASGRSVAFLPLIQVLDYRVNPDLVFKPNALLRDDVLNGMVRLLEEEQAPPDPDFLRRVVIATLSKDTDRNVRISAAILLGFFKRPDALNALIESLKSSDFGITFYSEESLKKITGYTNHRSYSAWRSWQEKTVDPFARAGETPEELTSPPDKKPWWKF